jgi:hypothetical protein
LAWSPHIDFASPGWPPLSLLLSLLWPMMLENVKEEWLPDFSWYSTPKRGKI